MIHRQISLGMVLIVSLHCLRTPASAQTDLEQAAKTKREAVKWLDSFSRHQALFHADDVKKLQERVAAMPPEEAALWWEKTAPIRKVLGSQEWRETEEWLRKYLAVQAKYSDDEIRYFQSEAATKAKESAGSLQEVLDRVVQARRKLVGGAQAAEETRKLQVAANQAYRQQEVQQREEALREARSRPAAPPSSPPVVRKPPRRDNGPLVDSLDVARWAILHELYPRW